VDVSFQELYAYQHSTTDETTDEDEVGRMQGDLIDLEPEVRDAIVLALPTNPVCRPDCPGLCPDCGVHWDDLPPEHTHDVADPRWAALQSLREPASESTDAEGARRAQASCISSSAARPSTPSGRVSVSGISKWFSPEATTSCRSRPAPRSASANSRD